MVKVLLDRGADVDALASDTFKRPGTPLLSVLKKGYDISSDYEYEKQALIIKMLIDKGCDVNLSRKQEFCPLGMCSLWKDYRSMQMLLDSGANATEVNPSSGKSPVMDILDSGDPKSLQIFERSQNTVLQASTQAVYKSSHSTVCREHSVRERSSIRT